MAAVINTSDDLLKLLAENTEFYQAVRRLILTDELIELPEKFAKFVDRVETFIARQETFNEDQRQFNAEQRQFNEDQRQFNRQVETFIAEQRQFNQRIETSIGELKGSTARYVVGVLFSEIATHLGFTFQDTLMRRDLNTLIGPQGHTVSKGDRQSFVRADLVVVATDADGDTHYVAVEASYTADERDTRRARRNADLLQRLTGCPAHAVIASVHNVDSVRQEIDDGAVHWYALDPKDFAPA